MRERDYYYEQKVDFDGIEIMIEKVNRIGVTRMEDEEGVSYFKGSDVVSLLKVHNDVPKSFTIGKVINAEELFDIEGILKYDEKTNTATKYSPYWLTLEALDKAFKNSRYNTEYVFETLDLLNSLVSWEDKYGFVYEEKNEIEVVKNDNLFGLKTVKVDDEVYIDSRDVAEMVEKRHADLVRSIEKYESVILANAKLRSPQFFIESAYIDVQNKSRKHYLLTKKGCDMVANKMTGEKGILFTATYVEVFNAMEKHMNELVQIETEKRVIELEEENQLLRLSIKENQAIKLLEEYANEVESYTATEVATEIKEDVIEMNKWLAKLGVQHKVGTTWVINQKYTTNGFTVLGVYRDQHGEEHTYTRWTEKGKEFIHNLYSKTNLVAI